MRFTHTFDFALCLHNLLPKQEKKKGLARNPLIYSLHNLSEQALPIAKIRLRTKEHVWVAQFAKETNSNVLTKLGRNAQRWLCKRKGWEQNKC